MKLSPLPRENKFHEPYRIEGFERIYDYRKRGISSDESSFKEGDFPFNNPSFRWGTITIIAGVRVGFQVMISRENEAK